LFLLPLFLSQKVAKRQGVSILRPALNFSGKFKRRKYFALLEKLHAQNKTQAPSLNFHEKINSRLRSLGETPGHRAISCRILGK